MKLILMTLPPFFVEEHQILTALFDEGLDILHMRKPNTEPVYSERLLQLLPDNYRKQIVVHDHFYLKNEYGLKGIHLNQRNPELPVKYKGQISCSCLTEEEIKQRKKTFDYLFFSSLYETTDGEQFTPRFTPAQIKSMSERKVIDKKVMAMGGIDLERIPFLRDNGVGGVVLLGAILNRFQIHSTQDFREIISHFRKIRKATN